MTTPQSPFAADDLLWRQLKTVPAFRALLRAVESRFYRAIDLPGPILDLGCGDGHFAQMTWERPLTAGVDPWWGPLQKARRSGAYHQLAQSMGDRLPFPDHYFAAVISNSVLEHIPHVQPVLHDVGRVLRPGGRLVITMPSHYFTAYLGGAAFLEKLGGDGLADSYRRFFNKISRHAHTDPPEVWADRLAQAGLAVDRWQYYFSQDALRALEWGHVQGLPSAILHFLTGHWILGPWESNLARTERWVRPFYEEPFGPEGAYLLFIAHKAADTSIPAALPPAQPFTPAELAPAEPAAPASIPDMQPAAKPSPAAPVVDPETAVVTSTTEPDKPRRGLFNPILGGLALLCALIGQLILSGAPPDPAAGLRWYGTGGALLLLLAWRLRRQKTGSSGRRLPHWRKIPRRRWYYLLALVLGLLPQGLAGAETGGGRVLLALLAWLSAMGIAAYALYKPAPTRSDIDAEEVLASGRFTILVALSLFLTALIVRAIALGQLPFILDGTEASIGLDVLAIVRGDWRNPFATGWLTNPTLPYYLLAVPVGALGPSVVSLRLLSPLVGALTVVAVYLLGRRIWGQAVGLIAAVLLIGMHFHLHYSRLGLTNSWDPLLVLLAFGLLLLAAERNSRPLWLLAGGALGLNAYLFTSSHLLPLMLVALLLLAFIFARQAAAAQWRHLLAALALALVVALPLLLHYNSHPGDFMARARAVGIFSGQSGWLSAETARTGQSPFALLGQQLRQATLAFNYSLDQSGLYRPQRPLLSIGMALLYVVGTAVALGRSRQLRYSLLLVWVWVPIIFGGALLLNPPSSHRLVITTPALSLLAALGLVQIGHFIQTQLRNTDNGSPATGNGLPHMGTISLSRLLPLLLVVAMLLTLGDIWFYFGRYRSQHTFSDRNTEIAHNVAHYLHDLPDDWTAYFYGPPAMYVSFPTIPFLATNFQEGVNLFDVIEPGTELPPPATANQTFIFLPERAGEMEPIQNAYPGGRKQTFAGFHTDPLFYVYEVRP